MNSFAENTENRISDSDDWVLSEVHLNPQNGPNVTSLNLRRSIFESSVLTRPIIVFHRMATPLEDVGLQLWSGSLILAELILSHDIVSKKHVLELGAGLGFVSIAAVNADAHTVFATDLSHVLNICEKNAVENNVQEKMLIRALDLLDSSHPLFSSLEQQDDIVPDLESSSTFGWKRNDIADLMTNELIIIAADIVYDNQVTFAFVQRMFDLLCRTQHEPSSPQRTLYMSLERRIQFSLDDMDIAAPGQDFFFNTLDAINADREEQGFSTISRHQISNSDIPQLFEYNRSEQLEVWVFTSS